MCHLDRNGGGLVGIITPLQLAMTTLPHRSLHSATPLPLPLPPAFFLHVGVAEGPLR